MVKTLLSLRFLIILVPILGLTAGIPAAARAENDDFNGAGIAGRLESFTSGGKTIHVERFSPGGAGSHPAVILVHGADGLTMDAWTARYRSHADFLARAGYEVFFVHYFDSTGTGAADGRTIVRNFMFWMKTVSDAITYASKQREVNGKKIGLFGFSLGASVSLILASQDPRISTVVEYFGAIPDELLPYIRRMPPTLILHGTADRLVPLENARKIQFLLRQIKTPFDIKVYAGQGHGFWGAAEADATERTAAFLRRWLG